MAIESVVGSLVSKIAELLAEPVKKQLRYMFCFDNFVQEFNEQVMSLALALYRLQDAVDVAKRNAEEIEIDVNKWLEDAKNEIDGVNRLEKEKGKNGICFTWCPKWIRLFKLSKALEKKTETLRKLEENSRDFRTKVSHKAPLQDIEFLPSKEFTPSESSQEAFEHIMKALKDDNVNMIGLYGMGGVGKTTLVREVGRRAKETQLFDAVLLATVSQNPNVMYIQDQIANRLGLHFDVKTKEGRADLLWQRLKTEKKMLVILDDVWKVVNLKEIGIPVGDAHRGCKVLLTTRGRDICSYMECQPTVFLRILSENEAWDLFKINARLRDEDFNLNTVAEEVARECQGLPIALVTVGRALRDKSTVEWEVASKQLKNSQFNHMELIGEQKNIYSCLKFSYDYLKHEETKLCFLLCCLFPEDYNIPIEDLTRYAVGYGLHQDVESIEDARKQVYVAIKTLKDCCMLLGTETEEKVKMHDLVRDVAIQIASSKEHGFMVKAGTGLKEWPRSTKSFESCKTISLMGNQLAELPERLVYPQLKVLLLELDYNLSVPERFFEGMKGIEVLSLKRGCLSLQSLEFSTKLKSLLLIKCKCNDLIWLRKLPRLEILCFIECSSVKELPDEIGELKELRLLDVTDCTRLRRIPVNLIGGLKKLEELLIGDNSFEGWDAVGCDSTGGMNASLTELNLLSHLAVLSLKIPRVECIPRDFVFPRLLKYDIVLGNGNSRTEHPTSTRLYLDGISAASLNAKIFEQLFPTVSQIGFINVEGLENIALSCDQMTSHGHGSQKDFFQRLEDVKVYGCRDTRTLFPAKWRKVLNNLTSVEIGNCKSLEVVFELGEAGEGINEEKELRQLSSLTRHVSLQSLVHLELQGLDKLTFIFTPHLAQSLVHLETLRIGYCSELKHLIGEEKDDEREIILESLGFFPKLKTLSIRGCDQLEYVFTVSVSPSLVHLETLKIDDCSGLKHLIREKDDEREIIPDSLGFPKLKTLSISHCGKLEYVFTVSVSPSLVHLETLQIDDCSGLKHLIREKDDEREIIPDSLGFPKLKTLSISHCGKLEYVFTVSVSPSLVHLETLQIDDCSGLKHLIREKDDEREIIRDSLGFPKLKTLFIRGCDKLEYVFTISVSPSLVHLETLQIDNCSGLKHLIREKDDEREIIPDSLGFPKLKTLSIGGCDKLEYVFPVSVSPSLVHLETLQIDDCRGLKHLIREKDDEREIIPDSLGFPKLKTLSIRACNELEYVFPVSVSPSLLNLEEITISYCCHLKQIFYSGEGDAHTSDDVINFPRLRKLSLSSCSFFYPKNFTAHLSSLQVLYIAGFRLGSPRRLFLSI